MNDKEMEMDAREIIERAGEILHGDSLKVRNETIQVNDCISDLMVEDDFELQTKVNVPTQILKPKKYEFFRAYIEMEKASKCYGLEIIDGMSKTYHMVTPNIAQEIQNQVQLFALQVIVTATGKTFLWPLKTYGVEDDKNSWNASAWEGATLAYDDWVKVEANMPQEQYDITIATADFPEPLWPKMSYKEMIRKVLDKKMIKSMNHRVLKKLRGEIR